MSHLHLHGGVLEDVVYGGGKVDKYTTQMNFKDFYKELHDKLVDMGFKDVLGSHANHDKYLEGWAKAGEFVDTKVNRTGDMFEYHFQWSEMENGWIDLELKWKALLKSKLTPYGWVVFDLDLSCRNYHDVELLEGNSKKILQEGSFEFRNKFTYKNSVHRDYLNNIPFVKNSDFLKNFYVNRVYNKILETDYHWAEHEVVHEIYHIIEHHFAPGQEHH